jgi:uncharacterized protein YodC (DUF2158 family)
MSALHNVSKPPQFTVGDVAQLPSGGALMTVERTSRGLLGGVRVHTVWVSAHGGYAYRSNFDARTLRKLPA